MRWQNNQTEDAHQYPWSIQHAQISNSATHTLGSRITEKGPPKDQFRIFVLTVQLQEYINKPHEMPLWTTNTDGLILHNTIL